MSVSSRAGRPPSRPDGDVPAYLDLAWWLVDQLESDPPITRTQVAAMIPSKDGTVAVSTVSEWLKGRRNVDPRLVEVIVAARSEYLSQSERTLLAARAAELKAAADIAEQGLRRTLRRPVSDRLGVVEPRHRADIHAECRERLQEAEHVRRVAEKHKLIADETITALAGQLDALVVQQTRERQQLHAQVRDSARHAEQLQVLRLENVQLRAALDDQEAGGRRSSAVEAERRVVAELAADRESLIRDCRALEEQREGLHLWLAEAERRRKALDDEYAADTVHIQRDLAELDARRRAATADLESLMDHQRSLHQEIDHLARTLNTGQVAPDLADASTAPGSGDVSTDLVYQRLYQTHPYESPVTAPSHGSISYSADIGTADPYPTGPSDEAESADLYGSPGRIDKGSDDLLRHTADQATAPGTRSDFAQLAPSAGGLLATSWLVSGPESAGYEVFDGTAGELGAGSGERPVATWGRHRRDDGAADANPQEAPGS